MNTTALLQLTVQAVDQLHPLIRRIVLVSNEGRALPGFTAGAHVRVQVLLPSGQTDWRHYSLVNFEATPQAMKSPASYTIGVRLEPEGRGGSSFMHKLRVGDSLTVETPRNDFPLGDHHGAAVLVAGGIGVTPLTAMAAERKRLGRPVRMIYAGRSRAQMAFAEELGALLGNGLSVHADEEAGAPLNVNAMLDACDPSDVVYVCGPKPMLDAILAAARDRGWPQDRVRFEIFSAPAAQSGDRAFDVVLQQSRRTLHVAEGQTILERLEQDGCSDVLADCRRGECGVCAVGVVEGEIDHRDYVLTVAEKAAGKVIQICVSRAKGTRLVLDL